MTRVIQLVPAMSPLQTTPVVTEAELRSASDVLQMAYRSRQASQQVIDRLRAKLGLEPDDRRVPEVK